MGKISTNLSLRKEYKEKMVPPPYHVFTRLGVYFVFDTSTCRFYEIDGLAYEVLKLCLDFSIEEAQEKLIKDKRFPVKAIREVAAEVKLLSDNGLFDVPDYSMSDEQIIKDINRAYSKPIHCMELGLTEACNLACKYCYCGSLPNISNSKVFMTEKVAQKAVDWLFESSGNAKSVHIIFFGGEPLLNKSVIRFVIEYSQQLAKGRNKKVTYSMTTNATLIDDEFLELAQKYKIAIMVSFDGPKNIHDAQCPTRDGGSSYDMVAAGARKLLRTRRTTVRCTMTHPAPKVGELVGFLEDFGFGRIVIEPTINPLKAPRDVDFTSEDFADYADQLEGLIPGMLKRIESGEKLKYDPFDKIVGRINNCTPNTNIKKCGACHGSIFVSTTGSLFPCHRFGGMKKWEIGHISDVPDYDLYKKFWYDYRKSLAHSCDSCWAWAICKGPCPWELVRSDGTFENSVRFCESVKAKIECAAYVYAWKQAHNIPAAPSQEKVSEKSKRILATEKNVYNKSCRTEERGVCI